VNPRLALPDEADAIRDLVRAAYAHYVPRLGREPFPMTDDYPARIAAGQAWWVPGIAVLVLVDEDGLLLDNIAVAEAARGLGHGRALIAFAEAEARRRGHGRIWLYTNEKMVENIALYTRAGFAETHREEQASFRRVFMEKWLSSPTA
jgi:GNAT superfamily N-acetyltransferase